MSLKEFDWKNFLLMKGEYLGLGVCVLGALLLVVLNLFMPGHGFFTGSGVVNAEVLQKLNDSVDGALKTNKPSGADNPPEASKVDLANEPITDHGKFQLAGLFESSNQDDARRRVPQLLQPTEGKVAVVLAQLKSYIFDRDYTKAVVLKQAKAPTTPTSAASNPAAMNQQTLIRLLQARGAAAGGAGRFNQSISRGAGVISANSTKPELEEEMVPVEKIGEGNTKLADSVLPLRMAVIVASFPYKQQIDEFMKQLQLPDEPSVLSETSTDDDGNQVASFRFMGVECQRRTVDSEGKPVSDWEQIDLESSYKQLLLKSGKRFEHEDGKLSAISFPGLVMVPLQQFRENQYPDVEMQLEGIKKTTESLKTKDPEKEVAAPGIFQVDDFNVFGAGTAPAAAGTMQRNVGGVTAPRPQVAPAVSARGPRDRDDGGTRNTRALGTTGPAPGSGQVLPEYCLVRLIDMTIEPGKIYQYRIRVHMANPNYHHPNVASPNYATGKELKTDRWFEIPDKVMVPPEVLIYNVDQMEEDGGYKKYNGPNKNIRIEKDRQIAMQIHKWLEKVDDQDGLSRPIGEWVVAERLAAYRGEYISRRTRCEVPEWKRTREEFILASENTGRARRKETGITVDFSQKEKESDAILADFEGGELLYTHESHGGEDGRVEKPKVVKDKEPIEALILSPDGKLLSRESTADAANEERKNRLAAYLERLDEVKEAKSHGGDNKSQNASPFRTRDR